MNDFLFLFAIIVFLYDVSLGNTKLRFRKTAVVTPFLLLLVFATLSGYEPIFGESGKYVTQFLKSYLHLIEMLSLFLLSFFYDNGEEKIRKLVKWWLVIGLLSNFYAIYGLFARPLDLPGAFIFFETVGDGGRGEFAEGSMQVVLSYGDFFRATSFFSEPSALAGFNQVTFLFFVAPKLFGQGFVFESKLFNTLFLLTWIPAQLFTFSLSAVFLFTISTLLIFYFKGLRFTKKLLPYLLTLALLGGIFDLIQASYSGTSVIELLYQRISSILLFDTSNFVSGESAVSRFASYESGWEIWEQYPLVGTGLGLTYLNGIVEVKFMEMSIMAVLVEMGFFAMVVYIIAYFYFSIQMLIRAKSIVKDNSQYPEWFPAIYIIFTIILVYLSLSGLIISNSVGNYNHWILMSLIVLVFQAERKFSKHKYIELNPIKKSRLFLEAGLKT